MNLEDGARAAERAVLAKVAEALEEKLVQQAEVLGHDGEGMLHFIVFITYVQWHDCEFKQVARAKI